MSLAAVKNDEQRAQRGDKRGNLYECQSRVLQERWTDRQHHRGSNPSDRAADISSNDPREQDCDERVDNDTQTRTPECFPGKLPEREEDVERKRALRSEDVTHGSESVGHEHKLRGANALIEFAGVGIDV